jgi:hypothetical protein
LLATQASAHHGWSEYDAERPLNLSGTIEESGYENPHGFVRLKTAGKTWHVVLAPPSRLPTGVLQRKCWRREPAPSCTAIRTATSPMRCAPNASR